MTAAMGDSAAARRLLERAVAHGQRGDVAAARADLERADTLKPGDADILYNLGQALQAAGERRAAVDRYRRALAADPSYAEAAFGLGECLYLEGDADAALPHLAAAAAALPGDAHVGTVHALALDRAGRTAEAAQALGPVALAHPDYPDALLNLALLLIKLRDIVGAIDAVDLIERRLGGPAIAYLEQAVARGAASPAAFAAFSQLYRVAARTEEAIALGARAVADPDAEEAGLITRAEALAEAGDFDGAEADLTRLLARRPDDPSAMFHLSVIRRLPAGAAADLERIVADEARDPSERATAGFTLYNLLNGRGDPRAFATLAAANAIRAALKPYDAAHAEALVEATCAAFGRDMLEAAAARGSQRDGAIFIVGMPRSGTSLTEQILAAHSRIHGGGERLHVASARRRIRGYPMSVPGLADTVLRELGDGVHAAMFREAEGRRFATDKLPGNLDHVGLIRTILPRSRFVYCRRQAGDVALSNFEQNFEEGFAFSFDLKAIAHRYAMHERLIAHWRAVCPEALFEVDYDALVVEPEPYIRRLLAFIGVEFEEACLYPHEVVRGVRTASVYQVRQPISASSVGRWKRYETDLQPFVAELERLRCGG